MSIERMIPWLSLWICLAQVAAAEQSVDFTAQVAPIFAQHCVRCHSASVKSGKLSLATSTDLLQTGYVVAGDPDGSYLLEVITSQDNERPAMPQEGTALSSSQVELIRKWIQQGAEWPQGVVVQQKSKADSSWWAYQPLKVSQQDSQSDSDTQAKRCIDDFIRLVHRFEWQGPCQYRTARQQQTCGRGNQ